MGPKVTTMSIYAGLAEALAARREDVWEAGFAELERLIGRALPASAYKYPAWWSNNPANNAMTKIWLRAGWRTEQVDVPGRTVVFRRAAAAGRTGAARFGGRPGDFEHATAPGGLEYKATGHGEGGRPYEIKAFGLDTRAAYPPQGATQETGEAGMMEKAATYEGAAATKTPFERLYGCMKGTIKIAPGVDITKPVYTDEEWAEIEAESDRKWDELLKSASDKKGSA